MSATFDHDVRAAMRPMQNPQTGTFTVDSTLGAPLSALTAGHDRRVMIRNNSAVVVGFLFGANDMDDVSAKALADTCQIAAGSACELSFTGPLVLYCVAAADGTQVSFLWDDVGGAS